MSRRQIQRVSMAAIAVAGVFALTACGSLSNTAPAAAPPPSSPAAPVSSQHASSAAEPPPTHTTEKSAGTAETPRCTTADLSVSLGKTKATGDQGAFEVPLTFKNTSSATCDMHGVPGVDLIGPNDPNGNVYHLTRVDVGVRANDIYSGDTATAIITVLTPTPGSVGSNGSKSWTPTKLVTIPPGQTQPLSLAWPSSLPVQRQDSATHPGSYVQGILSTPN